MNPVFQRGIDSGRYKPGPGARIDWRQDITDALEMCLLFNEGGGLTFRDCVGNRHTATSSSATKYTCIPGRFNGHALACAASGSTDRLTFSILNQPVRGATREVWLKHNGQSGYGSVCTRGNSTGLFLHNSDYQEYPYTPGNTALTAGLWYHIVTTTSGSTVNYYLNGQADGVQSGGVPDSDTIGSDTSSEALNGTIELIRFWYRALTLTEIRQLYDAPFRMFESPSPRKVFFIPSAAETWFPLRKKAPIVDISSPPTSPQANLSIAAFLSVAPAGPTAWFPMRSDRLVGRVLESVPHKPNIDVEKFSPPSVVFTPTAVGPTPLVQVDPRATTRTRLHEQIVANILNSLIRRKMLLRDTDLSWHYGYNPANPAHWSLSPPTTLEEALDRIAAAIMNM